MYELAKVQVVCSVLVEDKPSKTLWLNLEQQTQFPHIECRALVCSMQAMNTVGTDWCCMMPCLDLIG